MPMESLSAKSQPVLPKRTVRKDLVPGFQKANSLTEKYSQIRGTNFVTYACHFLENLKMRATFRSYPCDPPRLAARSDRNKIEMRRKVPSPGRGVARVPFKAHSLNALYAPPQSCDAFSNAQDPSKETVTKDGTKPRNGG